MPERAVTRRGALAAIGTTLFAGCSELNRSGNSSQETIPSTRFPDVDNNGDVNPIVVESIPVEIERTKLTEATQRVTDLLGELPVPFGPEDIPNGYVRQQLLNAADDATAFVKDARRAQTRLSAFQSLREARSRARYAATGQAFAAGETTKADLEVEYQEAVSEARSVQEDHEYLGTDPVDAVLIHARIEHNIDYVLTTRTPVARGESGPLLTAAGWGEYAESAGATIADSRYLYKQFLSDLPDDARIVEESLTTASELLVDDLRDRRNELPSEPTDKDNELVWRLRHQLWSDADASVEQATDAAGPASAVLTTMTGLTAFLAFNRVQDRINDGEEFRVQEAIDIQEARSQAHDAIRSALKESPRSDLARPVLADAAVTVAFADEELARHQGNVRLAQLDDPIRRYTAATARARSVPTACQRVLDTIDA